MTGYECAVTAFEIGSCGYISTRNHSALYSLHKFVKPGVKLAKFKQNISALAVYSLFMNIYRSSKPCLRSILVIVLALYLGGLLRCLLYFFNI